MFPDVPSGHHYLAAIEGVAGEGIMRRIRQRQLRARGLAHPSAVRGMICRTMGYPVSEADMYDFSRQACPSCTCPRGSTPITTYPTPPSRACLQTFGDRTFRPLYRETRGEAVSTIVLAGGDALAVPAGRLLRHPHPSRPWIAEALRRAEFNGLLDNIVGPSRRTRNLGSGGSCHSCRGGSAALELTGESPALNLAPLTTGCRAGLPGGRPGPAGGSADAGDAARTGHHP